MSDRKYISPLFPAAGSVDSMLHAFEQIMQTIAILGTGLMGSSLGLALKKRKIHTRIHAFARRSEVREAVLRIGAADKIFSDPAEAVKPADLIIFCVPVLTIPELAEICRNALKPGAVLTDVGSTKACLNKMMVKILEGTESEFVGSHPICGSEQQGIEAGNADLYEKTVTVITPADSSQAAVETVSRLWQQVGSSVVTMSAEEHDRILAATSHLPHIAAAALVMAENGQGAFCGSGFRDTTRIAEGSPQVWSDIVRTNAPALKAVLKTFRGHLDELESLIDLNDEKKLIEWFATARNKRKELLG